MNRIFKALLTTIILFSLSACGGGGGSSEAPLEPNDPNLAFPLFPSGYFSGDYKESYALTGSLTASNSDVSIALTGTHASKTGDPSLFDAVEAVPVISIVNVTLENGEFISSSSTSYYSTDIYDLHNLGSISSTSILSLTSITTEAVPVNAQIGDLGNIGTYIDGAGDQYSITWQLVSGGGDRAKFIIRTSKTEQSGAPLMFIEESTLIDQNGDRLSLELHTYDPVTGVKMDLSGNATH